MLLCWNCGDDLSDEPLPLSRQASCQKCGEFLHCCELCTQFSIGSIGDCSNQLADPPTDKSTANFCEYFEHRDNYSKANPNTATHAQDKLNALFGIEQESQTDSHHQSNPTSKNPLDDLFDD